MRLLLRLYGYYELCCITSGFPKHVSNRIIFSTKQILTSSEVNTINFCWPYIPCLLIPGTNLCLAIAIAYLKRLQIMITITFSPFTDEAISNLHIGHRSTRGENSFATIEATKFQKVFQGERFHQREHRCGFIGKPVI